jgi:PAS domain S-box-containing protein
VGALYLENGPAAGSFAPPTIAVLKLLASQAAITLENARLYRDLVEREAKIRRLVDANIVGIFIYSTDGLITEANEAFLRMLGYDREDLLAGEIRWADLTPPDWLQRDMELWEPMLERTGVLAPFEKEYFRKDGSRVPVLIGVANFDESSGEGVAFVLDLTEQKHAEAEARENEQRYRDVQTTLAHANRVTTMGQLAATISHEVKQPIAATVTNAEAGLRLLGRQPPRLQEARQAFERIIESAMSAGDVINRIRSVVRNSPPRKERVQLNAAIREVAAIMRGEAAKNHVSVRLHLGEDLPLVRGDRVQLQQVVMNLVLNAIEAMGVVDEFSRELTISTRKNMSGSAVVSVSDTGPGISSAVGEHLFEPFFTTKDAGMGIGLAICQSILDVHGGQLRVFANVPRGAVFEFVLPRSLDITPGLA